MSCRKSPTSRKSSTQKHSNKTMINAKHTSNISVIITPLVLALYHLLVIGYIVTLEGQKCNCISDWRHDFIKYYSASMIFYGLVILSLNGTSYFNSIFVIALTNYMLLLSFVNVWCLYTYVGDLDKTKCLCAIEKQKNMHYFLYIWRYVLVGAIILSLIIIIAGALSSK
jgi:hypothetical protein